MRNILYSFFIFGPQLLWSQVWNFSDEPEIGDQEIRYLVDTTSSNYAALTGANQTWDYSELPGYPDNIRPIVVTDASNYQAVYSDASHVFEIPGFMTMIYEYNAADQKISRGFELNIPDFGLVNAVFDDLQIMLNFPLSSGDGHQDAFDGDLIILGGTNPLVGDATVEIDGTGELLLANGVSYTEVLRVHTLDTIYAEVTLDGLPFPTNVTIIRNQYDYLKSSESPFPLFTHASLEILNPLIGQLALNLVLSAENPTTVIGVQETSLDEVQIFPNPTQDFLSVRIPENWNDALIKVYDLSGKELIQMHSNEALQVIDVSNLLSGIYFLKIITQEGEKTLRFEVH